MSIPGGSEPFHVDAMVRRDKERYDRLTKIVQEFMRTQSMTPLERAGELVQEALDGPE